MTMKPRKFSTTSMINISTQNHKIKLIKLGFDFSFHPVCFVADRNGLRNYTNVDHRGEWSADEYTQSQSIYQRSPFDTMGWSEVQHGGLAMELKKHAGLWALKGDRIDGLDVQLGELGTLWILRDTFEGEWVWNVFLHMEKPKEGTLQRIFK